MSNLPKKWLKKPTVMTLIYWIRKVLHILMTSIYVPQKSFSSEHKNFSNTLCLRTNNEKQKVSKRSKINIKNDIDFIIDFLIFTLMNWMFWKFSNEFYPELCFKLLSIHNDLSLMETYEEQQRSLNLYFLLIFGKNRKALFIWRDVMRMKL